MKIYQRFIWLFLKSTFGIFSKLFFNIKYVKTQKEPNPPYLLLANHSYHIEAFFIAYFLKSPVHYLSSDEIAGLSQRILGNLTGIIYTEKGNIDASSIREIIKYVKKGDNIAIFPEGDGTWDGETVKFSIKIIKLIRMLNIPIMTINLQGSYLTKSRWARYLRRGKIIINSNVITLDEINKMDDIELYDRISKNIYNNELKNTKLEKVKFKGKKITEGIQYLLWLCPECHSHDTIIGDNNTIKCLKCSKIWEINANLKILNPNNNITDLKDWSEWQKFQIEEFVNNNKSPLTESKNVKLNIFESINKKFSWGKRFYKPISEGDLILLKDKLIFKPDNSDKNIEFNITEIKNYVDCVNKYFRFNYDQTKYEINFKGKNSSKYLNFFKFLQNN